MENELPWQSLPVLYTVPGMSESWAMRELSYRTSDGTSLGLDAYHPVGQRPARPLPGVVFIHGGPVTRGESLKDAGQYRSWGALAAASGMIGITFNHRYHAPEQLAVAADDVQSAIAAVRERGTELSLDPERICLWTCSGGGPLITFALRRQPSFVRSLVVYYAIMDPRVIPHLPSALDKETLDQLSPVAAIGDHPISFPIFLARAGKDDPSLNETIDDFTGRCMHANLAIELLNHPQGEHGFDIATDDRRTRQIIARTLTFIRENT